MTKPIKITKICPHCEDHGIPCPFELEYEVYIGEEIVQVNFEDVCPQCGEYPNLDEWVLSEAYDIHSDAVEYAREARECAIEDSCGYPFNHYDNR